MSLVEIRIKKDLHQIACAEGEEEKVLSIANKLKEKIETLSGNFTSASDKTIYLIASLMVIDEIEETKGVVHSSVQPDTASEVIDEVSEKIEKLINKLKNTTSDVVG